MSLLVVTRTLYCSLTTNAVHSTHGHNININRNVKAFTNVISEVQIYMDLL